MVAAFMRWMEGELILFRGDKEIFDYPIRRIRISDYACWNRPATKSDSIPSGMIEGLDSYFLIGKYRRDLDRKHKSQRKKAEKHSVHVEFLPTGTLQSLSKPLIQ